VNAFALLPASERRLLIDEVAARQSVVSLIVEKDFWVCWILGVVFSSRRADSLVFKGGISLSKVFRVIDRFSEDVDLAVPPVLLGLAENDLERDLAEAPSASQRSKRMKTLDARCEAWVRDELQPRLENAIAGILGNARMRANWLSFDIDSGAGTPNLWFWYPSVHFQPGGYVATRVKLELGMLTRQQPTGEYTIVPMLARTLGSAYEDFSANVVALDLARTFWKKATILHAEYHRPAGQPIRDRSARHYADFAALWHDSRRNSSLDRLDLLEDVVSHKIRFFGSSWASYETARPGMLRLLPAVARHSELARDYDAMKPMFLTEPPTFNALLECLAAAEEELNGERAVSKHQ